MSSFDTVYEHWMALQIAGESSPRRREFLQRGLSRGTMDYLRLIWYPAIGSLDHLYPEYEVRDFNNGYRYLDLAYMPGHVKGCIEIQDYRSHARDIEASRFKDLCMKQSLLVLDDWLFLPIAYLSIREDAGVCQQLTLSFVGKFLSSAIPPRLDWSEAETLRWARRLLRPFTPGELAAHLRLTEQYTRLILRRLVSSQRLVVTSGQQRYRTYMLPEAARVMR
ncbi:transcriptional regulator [Paenibacillus tarimensis]|uniref:transcriptional regulator n=1 Tax=Paenibacillus tarimensis TaxID=416012 RepID=UPI001F454724|nr:transcriptional regulator [Paenibacillus tarimensis]MCF2945132.1 transcriptional regulator [Paenibacillus tarimensis]